MHTAAFRARFILPLSIVALLAACSPPEQGPSGVVDAGPDASIQFDLGVTDNGGDKTDSATPKDSAAVDVPVADVQVDSGQSDVATDSGTLDAGPADGGGTPDAGGTPDTGGTAPLKCGQHEFTYDAPAGTQNVLVSGTFNDWADAAPQAAAMSDDDGDGTWSVVMEPGPGSWEYKFVVDGKWLLDPNNPDKVFVEKFNTHNSLLVIDPCPEGMQVISHKTTGSDFTAELSWLPVGLKQAAVKTTLDWQAAPAGAVSVAADGKTVTVNLKGLSKGIHDLRVEVDGEFTLLKILVDTSADWRDAVLYFVMTDRFANGDKANDKPVPGVDARTNYQGGDFAGVTAKIEAGYFDNLGVNALWLSWPVDNPDGAEKGGFPDQGGCNLQPKTTKYSEMKYTGNHGYWPAKLYETDEHFGTMDELKSLVVAAHKRGIRVLLDFTANHVHTASPFYNNNKDKGWFHLPAEICQDVGWDNKPVTCWFTSYLADLNYSNKDAIAAMLDYAMFWAKQTGSDGFRLDAVKHVEMDFVTALRKRAALDMELTDIPFYIVGETFTGDAGTIAKFVGPDKIHGQFDFPANLQILKGFAKNEIGLDAMDKGVRGAKGVYGGDALMSNFVGNHDIARFISHAGGNLACGLWDVVSNQAAGWKNPPKPPASMAAYDRLKLAFTYIMAVPGVPLIYYGDEFGLPGAGDPDNRRMMRFDGDLNGNEKAMLAWMKKLGAARAAHPALRKGDWSQPLWSAGDVLAWARTTADDKVVVVLNRSDADKSGDVDVSGSGIADGTTMVELLAGGDAKVAGGKLSWKLGPRQAGIWAAKK